MYSSIIAEAFLRTFYITQHLVHSCKSQINFNIKMPRYYPDSYLLKRTMKKCTAKKHKTCINKNKSEHRHQFVIMTVQFSNEHD